VRKADGLVRAICESPDDDQLRLVYADWLDEHGDPARAEFVRLQCALDGADAFAPGRRARLRREWELLRRHGMRWIGEDGLADVIEPDSLWHRPPKTRFRRGLVDRAWFHSPDDFLRDAPRLFARAPITGISLWSPYTVAPDRDRWFTNTYYAVFQRENGLPVHVVREPCGADFPEPDEFRRLVASPHFAGLRSFAMDTLFADRRHLEILTTSPAATGLRELDLSGNICIVGEAWAALAGAPALAGLESLSLDRCHLGASGLRTLVNSPHLVNLQRLSLEADRPRTSLGAQGIELICASQALRQLRELNLHGQSGGVAGLRALAAWPGLTRLTRLDLSDFSAEVPDEPGDTAPAWAAFVRSPHWGPLRELDLEGNCLEDLEAVLDGPNLATLRVLTFAYAFCRWDGDDEQPLQDEAAALLARCPHLAGGLELQFPSRGLSQAGRRLLQDCFGDGLVLYPDDGLRHRQPGDWASGRPSWSTFQPEEGPSEDGGAVLLPFPIAPPSTDPFRPEEGPPEEVGER
jgi:uncharacterized protein (TIGR02996 family)